MTHDEIYEGRVARDKRNYPVMTYNELLIAASNSFEKPLKKATLSVVELHKPVMSFTGGYDGEENELWAEECRECSCDGFSQMYPCPTIQAIEKGLGL